MTPLQQQHLEYIQSEVIPMTDEQRAADHAEISVRFANSQWINVNDRLPEILETVWISNGKGCTTLGCRSDLYEETDENGESIFLWCWAKSNGIIYEEHGKIVSECENDDLDVVLWHPVPKPPINEPPKQG